jgi:hypothetical protein
MSDYDSEFHEQQMERGDDTCVARKKMIAFGVVTTALCLGVVLLVLGARRDVEAVYVVLGVALAICAALVARKLISTRTRRLCGRLTGRSRRS